MAKTEALAFVKCPECDHDKAEIKRDKKGLLYRWCPECNAQYFTRKQANSDRLETKIFGKKEPENVEIAPVTDTGKTDQKAPEKKSFSLGDL